MAAPTLVDLPDDEVARRFDALSDDEAAQAMKLKESGRSPSEAVQIVQAQKDAYMAEQPAAERARASGAKVEADIPLSLPIIGQKSVHLSIPEADVREAGAAAMGAGQMLSMGVDKAVADAGAWAKENPVKALWAAPALPLMATMGLLGEDKGYRSQVEKIQQDAPAAAQRGMAVGMIGDLATGAGPAKAAGRAALKAGGSLPLRLLKAGAEPAGVGAASGAVAGAATAEGGI
ncbi:MAG: hypothetical protein VW547_06305, partial [Alphaproteobacteria bacterium]